MSPSETSSIIRRFIEDAGNVSQSLGFGRVVGQIYAYLYFSQETRNLGDMQEALGISKGSASVCVRQLEQWGAVRKVWVKGDRKDYYEANDWFGRILKSVVADAVGKKMQSLTEALDAAEESVIANSAAGQEAFLKERLERVRDFQNKVLNVWNSRVLRLLLK